MAAAMALGRIGIQEGPHIDALVAFANNSHVDEAALTLCKLGASGRGVEQVLVQYIACRRYEVRHAVEASFRRLGAAGAGILARKLVDYRREERLASIRLLASCGAGAIPHAEALAECLTDDCVRVRFQAAKALATLSGGTAPCASALELCLADRDEAVRLQAAKALGRIGNDAEAQLTELRRVAKDDNSPVVRAAAVQACAAIESLYVVLTLHISSHSADGTFSVSCTNMAGEEMASTVADSGRPMHELKSAIACELGGQRFQMVLVSGHVLSVEELDRPLAEFADSAQIDVLLDDEMF